MIKRAITRLTVIAQLICSPVLIQAETSLAQQHSDYATNKLHYSSAPTKTQLPKVMTNEIIVDPQGDYSGDGKITGSDEIFELFNASYTNSCNLKGWRLELDDTTPAAYTFGDVVIEPRGFYWIINPSGEQNNNGEIRLYDNLSNLVDKVTYGNWNGGSEIPDGNASSWLNESLSRFPDGENNWVKTIATVGYSNVPSLENWGKLYSFKKEEGLLLYAGGLETKIWGLEESSDLKNWRGIFTNNFYNNLFSFTQTNTSKAKSFYRIIGRDW